MSGLHCLPATTAHLVLRVKEPKLVGIARPQPEPDFVCLPLAQPRELALGAAAGQLRLHLAEAAQ